MEYRVPSAAIGRSRYFEGIGSSHQIQRSGIIANVARLLYRIAAYIGPFNGKRNHSARRSVQPFSIYRKRHVVFRGTLIVSLARTYAEHQTNHKQNGYHGNYRDPFALARFVARAIGRPSRGLVALSR